MILPLRSALRVALLSSALLPATVAALPSRAVAQACLEALQAQADEEGETDPTVGKGGPACAALLKAAQDKSAGAIDQGLADSLSDAGVEALHDYVLTLPMEHPAKPAGGGRPPPDPAAVAAILSQLPDPAAARPGLWQRIDAWLHRTFFPDPQKPADERGNGLLGRLLGALLQAIPSSVGKALVWIVFALMMLMLVVIVVREIRTGLAGRRRHPQTPLHPVRVVEAGVVGTMPDQPAALLRWVIEVLAGRGQLPGDPALTNRQLHAQVPAVLQNRFASLMQMAERTLFGGQPVVDEERRAAQADARALTTPAGPAP